MSYARATRTTCVLGALFACLVMAGCAQEYRDRRDSLSLAAGDSLAANKLTHMVDPWPRTSGNRNIAFNGELMGAASERYRKGKVTRPATAVTSSTQYQPAQINLVAPTSASGNP